MQTAHVVFNPSSGSYSNQIAERITTALASVGLTPHSILPRSLDEAKDAVSSICKQYTQPTIIAAGGDGTINSVINSIPQGGATIGIIPMGTANVMARELGISSADDAVARIARGDTRMFSVGEATSSAETRRFILMAGIGFDASAVADVRDSEKRLLGKGAYVLSGMRQLINWDSSVITVRSGDREIRCNSLIVANAAHYAGPYKLAPQASLFSRRLDIIPMQFSHPLSFLRFSCSVLLRGKLQKADRWSVGEETIKISGEKKVQLDGDSFGTIPLSIRLIPDFNKLII